MHTPRKSKAFTLIELVVVIVILGVLAVLAAFTYTNFIRDTKTTSTSTLITQFDKSYTGSKAVGTDDAKAFTDAVTDAGDNVTITRISRVAVPRTNLIINPSFETNTTGWTATNATYTNPAVSGGIGARVGQITVSATNAETRLQTSTFIPVTAGRTYTIGMYNQRVGTNVRQANYVLTWRTSAGAVVGTATTTPAWAPPGAFTDPVNSAVVTAPATAARVDVAIVLSAANSIAGEVFRFDAISFEERNGWAGYFDGSYVSSVLGGGTSSWNGTAHGSTSTWSGVSMHDLARIVHGDNTWCYGLPADAVNTTAVSEYTGAGNPGPGQYKKANCS